MLNKIINFIIFYVFNFKYFNFNVLHCDLLQNIDRPKCCNVRNIGYIFNINNNILVFQHIHVLIVCNSTIVLNIIIYICFKLTSDMMGSIEESS